MAGRIHQADIEHTLNQASHQVFLEADFAADRDVFGGLAHPSNPLRQIPFPQCDPRTDADRCAVSAREADIMACLFFGQNQSFCVLLETPSARGQAGTGTVAYEQPGTQLLFEPLDTCADG